MFIIPEFALNRSEGFEDVMVSNASNAISLPNFCKVGEAAARNCRKNVLMILPGAIHYGMGGDEVYGVGGAMAILSGKPTLFAFQGKEAYVENDKWPEGIDVQYSEGLGTLSVPNRNENGDGKSTNALSVTCKDVVSAVESIVGSDVSAILCAGWGTPVSQVSGRELGDRRVYVADGQWRPEDSYFRSGSYSYKPSDALGEGEWEREAPAATPVAQNKGGSAIYDLGRHALPPTDENSRPTLKLQWKRTAREAIEQAFPSLANARSAESGFRKAAKKSSIGSPTPDWGIELPIRTAKGSKRSGRGG